MDRRRHRRYVFLSLCRQGLLFRRTSWRCPTRRLHCDIDTTSAVGFGRVLHQAGDLAELAAYRGTSFVSCLLSNWIQRNLNATIE